MVFKGLEETSWHIYTAKNKEKNKNKEEGNSQKLVVNLIVPLQNNKNSSTRTNQLLRRC